MLSNKAISASSTLPEPSYVGTSSAYSTSGAPVVNAVAGVQTNDLIVVVLNCLSTSNYPVTVPSGFTVVGTNLNTQPVFVLLTKKATASEPSTYTFTTNDTGDRVHACMFVYRNATQVNTIGNLTASRGSATTATAQSITPTLTGELIAVFGITTSTSVTTPPSGMTLISNAQNTQNTVVMYRQSGSPASASGTKTVVFANSGALYGVLFQITNEPARVPAFIASQGTQNTGSGSTLVINKPAGTIENDLMIAFMASSQSAAADTWTGDTGWTEVADQNAVPNVRIAYKVATASEPASYTFTATRNTAILAGVILTYRSASYDNISAFSTLVGTPATPEFTVAASQSVLLMMVANNGLDPQATPIPLLTSVFNNADATSPSFIVASQIVPSGTSGIREGILASGNSNNVAIALSIKYI